MSNVKQLRGINPFKIGDRVCIGLGLQSFEIANLGTCGPDNFINKHEFVSLRVPGDKSGVFDVHVKFLNLSKRQP